ncbi:TspO/MBR family protein [Parasediminibacterium paludis]|uniref:TspO/MBR family protein n=1 Tax=Parasediminibacterium paludis TaxID=908966 RepID=A0ABV8PZL2_9BACT
MERSNIIKAINSIALTVGLGAASGYVTVREIPTWYATLNKPSFNPPNYLFGPVWTILYILMGISVYLIWKLPPSPHRKKAINLYLLQFVLNLAWSIIFFNQHQIFLALIEIIVMWFGILLTIFAFSKFSKLAAWLLVPYISWVSFAIILNTAIWLLNR